MKRCQTITERLICSDLSTYLSTKLYTFDRFYRLALKLIVQKIFVFIYLVTLSVTLTAQRGFEAGGRLGVSQYFGDLNTNFSLRQPGFTVGGDVRFNFDERFSLKGGLNYIFIHANDKYSSNIFQRVRNLHFRNNIIELSGQMELNFLKYVHGSRDEWFTPYLLLGGSVFAHSPQAKYEGQWYKLRDLGTEGQRNRREYSIVNGSWLFGMGFKVDLDYSWSLNVELCSRQAFTDYLDDVSTVYEDAEQVRANHGDVAAALSDPSIILPPYNDAKIGVKGRQRGDKEISDAYTTLTVGLIYYFGQVRCPEIVKH
jgi:hypothetical protein